MRRIAIIYDGNQDGDVAGRIGTELSKAGYETTLYPLDESQTIQSVYAGWGDIHLVITVNLAGFSYRSSGNNAVYSTLDFNSIHYIDRDVEGEEALLSGLITITMLFLTDDEQRKRRLHETYRRIHDVSMVSSIETDIVSIVDGLDWRKPE